MPKVYIKVSFGIQYAWPQISCKQLYCAAFMPTFKSLLIKYKLKLRIYSLYIFWTECEYKKTSSEGKASIGTRIARNCPDTITTSVEM